MHKPNASRTTRDNVPGRIAELDGLRTIAILLVLLYHLVRLPVPHHHLMDYPTRIFSFGWGGVDVFFVLSGFLIGGILTANRGRPGALRSFLTRRGVRIMPLYAAVVMSFYVLRQFLAAPWMFEGAPSPWYFATLTQNFATAFTGHDAWCLGPTWSLAVEVQVYVLMGVMMLYAPRRTIMAALWMGIVLALGLRLAFCATGHAFWGYFVTPARIDGACIGALASQAIHSERIGAAVVRFRSLLWSGCGGLVALAVLSAAAGQGLGSVGAAVFGHLGLSVASGIVIVLLVRAPGGLPSHLLASRPMVFLGVISYGIYLLHRPVIGTIHALAGRSSLLLDGWGAVILTTAGVCATICISWLSFRFFEGPLNAMAHRMTSRRPSPDELVHSAAV